MQPLERSLLERLSAALAAAATPAALPEAALLASAPRRRSRVPMVLALSGGRDSVALLDLAARLRGTRGSPVRDLVAVHVHHGLSRSADAWAEHCRLLAERLEVDFELVRVKVRARGQGLEAAAREARYTALAQVAQARGAHLVLTAHHLDDRLETFLIQWMRGAGVDGLAGFPAERDFAGGTLRLVRPLIDTPRAEIEAYATLRGLAYVDDESNEDTRLLRNALRLQVLPAMDAARPGFRAAAARGVDLVADAAEVLRSVAAEDLARCRDEAGAGTLYVDRVLTLPDARQALVLRAWLAEAGVSAPSRARLVEALRQVREARSDARLLVRLGGMELRRFRGHLLLRPEQAEARGAFRFQWRGEREVAVPSWGGVLRILPCSGEGLPAAWLAAEPLELRQRAGGERFKPSRTRPRRTLKRLFQDEGVPEFERARLPLVWRGADLIHVGGLGSDVRYLDDEGERVQLEWVADRGLIGF
ncbi:MAG TPA: tRNA lysidine(34) synthetase TilS [Burkholderiaceae bacterium]|nr:tRNA lysidine(34) synthetase TilS [Burkholderiaceae bacterium]HPE01106.1 tRNA lysidine(34) synthetase TilS [Burkholderiaceae bacterium]HRZ02293.1 tRNA lysidine(34) synthetase TilS [Burkholderiaceae bacterium]